MPDMVACAEVVRRGRAPMQAAAGVEEARRSERALHVRDMVARAEVVCCRHAPKQAAAGAEGARRSQRALDVRDMAARTESVRADVSGNGRLEAVWRSLPCL